MNDGDIQKQMAVISIQISHHNFVQLYETSSITKATTMTLFTPAPEMN